ncbi:NAD(P)-dependent dehydrogenase (short-subunit alcohol dehydrogenase family) [Rhodanobacter sp. K2T2]|uniref:SDR family NAD(P)-dependent oxidoreductase n=1 Tax=Rhodanobacter sp. K2T2 TaxID=2723085 RepID=UPI0015C84200|nr:SDR family NAD(P)-dependent oxidoreductase [Rhodanobacter sp. K2T2]NYE29527.1 NAD(P)-dependent dehydrogenase (short-subunit alcohol dehydrogenase family) [Rhodanobacter sp. K2T2]
MSIRDEISPAKGGEKPISVLLTGASSGIGLAMLRQLLGNRHIALAFAVSRFASTSEVLRQLRDTHGERLVLLDADITDEGDLDRLRDTVSSHTDALDRVINAAGVLHAANLQPEKALEQITRANLERVFALNAFAPILLAKALMPLLCHDQVAVFASLSARVGSIGDNRSGGWYAYRASKAAQNQLMKTFAIELARRNRNACCLLLHPGTVDTPLSAPFQARVAAEKLFTTERAATQLLQIIASRTAIDNGRFIAWDGTDVPW